MGKQVPAACVTGYALGLKQGYVVTKQAPRKKPSHRRKSSQRVTAIRKVIRTVVGLAPFEKRVLELYKIEDQKLEKRATKFLKKRLGGWRRANKKKEMLQSILKNRRDKKADFA